MGDDLQYIADPTNYELANQTIQNNDFKISSASAVKSMSYVTASYTGMWSPGVEQSSIQAITDGTTVTSSAPIATFLSNLCVVAP